MSREKSSTSLWGGFQGSGVWGQQGWGLNVEEDLVYCRTQSWGGQGWRMVGSAAVQLWDPACWHTACTDMM
jgi:hypothetical protein